MNGLNYYVKKNDALSEARDKGCLGGDTPGRVQVRSDYSPPQPDLLSGQSPHLSVFSAFFFSVALFLGVFSMV